MPVQVQIPAGRTITKISSGDYHSLALASDGTVWAWGYNLFGQLGNNTTTGSPGPVPQQVQIPSGRTISQIAAGRSHSLALASDGTAWAWGNNNYGQLGNNTTTNSSVPVQAQVPAGRTITQLDAGDSHSLALASDGTVWAWGYNLYGQLGNNTTTNSSVPVQVQIPAGRTITQLDAGGFHSLAVASDGTAWAWGNNGSGPLGNNTTTDSSVPVQAQVPAGRTITQIATSAAHSLAIASDGTAWAWGYNNNGQLGNNTTTRSLVPVMSKMPLVVSGVSFGGVAGTGLTQISPTQVTVVTPSHARGAVDVVLTTVTQAGAPGPTRTLPLAYTYDPVAPAAPSNLNLTGPTSGAYVLSGNGDAGSVVTVKDNAGTTVATATVSAGGSWSANIPTSTLGPLTLFATANALNSAQVTYSAAPLPMISNPAVAVAAGLMGAGLLLIRRHRNQSRA